MNNNAHQVYTKGNVMPKHRVIVYVGHVWSYTVITVTMKKVIQAVAYFLV